MNKKNLGKLIDINSLNVDDIYNELENYIEEGKEKTDIILYIKKFRFDELKNIITAKLSEEGIENLNELQVVSLNSFKKQFSNNIFLNYFIKRIFKKDISRLNSDEYIILGKKLGLESLSSEKVNIKIKNILSDNEVKSLDDLDNMSVREFINYASENLLIIYYFLKKGKHKSFIKKSDIKEFGQDIGLEYKIENDGLEIQMFLSEYKIVDYSDLIYHGVKEIREILWSNNACRKILEGFGLKYLQDFRENYIKKFARYIGLKGIPKENNELTSKELILNILKYNGIECMYSLKHNGFKGFVRIFKKSTIGEALYDKIVFFVKKSTGKTVRTLKYVDLDTIGKSLGLPELSDSEHKEKLINFLTSNGENFDSLSKTKIKTKYWKNPHIRYFLEKIGGPNDVKELRPIHVENMIKYLDEI